jgi:hypothetical protein
MSFFGSDPETPPAVPAIPTRADADNSGADQRKRIRMGGGRSSTYATSGLGDTSTPSLNKTKLYGA